MSKLRTVKEVCTLTGLNRKLLFDYKDVIKPSATSYTILKDIKYRVKKETLRHDVAKREEQEKITSRHDVAK